MLTALCFASAGLGCNRPPPAPDAVEATPEVSPIVVDVGGPVPAAEAPTHRDHVEAVSPTDLELSLMATLASDDPSTGRATIRNAEGLIATYRVGDPLAGEASLKAVHRDYVVLSRGEQAERLDFPLEMITLDPGDTFYPDFAALDDRSNAMSEAIQLVAGPGYVVKKPVFAWGTPRTIAAIRDAAAAYHRTEPSAPPVHVGDISKQNGGPFPPHLSHQTGRDVDVGYVLLGALAERRRFTTATWRTLDRARTWALLEAFITTNAVAYIFVDYGLQRLLYEYAVERGVPQPRLEQLFQYPRGSAASRGILRHWRGHANHFHVRFVR